MPAVRPDPDIVAIKRRGTERSERLPGEPRLEVLHLRAQRERKPVGHLERNRRVHVEGDDLRFAGDAGLMEDRVVIVFRGETERDVDAEPDDDALIQPVCRVRRRHERVRERHYLRRIRGIPSSGRGSSLTLTVGKMPEATTSVWIRSTAARLAGFQNIDDRLPPAAMPAKDEALPVGALRPDGERAGMRD